MGASSVIQVAAIAVAHDYINRERAKQRSGRSPAQRRQRMSIPEVFNSMGPRIFRRAFRMTLDSFWRLHSILLPHIRTAKYWSIPISLRAHKFVDSHSRIS